MGNWHIIFMAAWAVVFWYSISALLRPTEKQDSEWLPYIAELLSLVAIFFVVYSLQEIVTHYHVWEKFR